MALLEARKRSIPGPRDGQARGLTKVEKVMTFVGPTFRGPIPWFSPGASGTLRPRPGRRMTEGLPWSSELGAPPGAGPRSRQKGPILSGPSPLPWALSPASPVGSNRVSLGACIGPSPWPGPSRGAGELPRLLLNAEDRPAVRAFRPCSIGAFLRRFSVSMGKKRVVYRATTNAGLTTFGGRASKNGAIWLGRLEPGAEICQPARHISIQEMAQREGA